MKYPKSQTTGKAGVIYVNNIVNAQGSVFRPVHQEDDFGIDGFIEFVSSETASGHIIAVQIKSGDSYIAENKDAFEIAVDERHLEYWRNFMVPVILIGYSPKKAIAVWISVRDFIEHEVYHGRTPIKKITIPFHKKFDEKSISEQIAGLAHVRSDERMLLRCADMCLSVDPTIRYNGFLVLSQHPDSRELKITCMLARKLILDENPETAKDALFILGFGVGRQRWSFNPGNKEETEIIEYASNLCSDLNAQEVWRLVELMDDEYFNGPDGLGERCLDVLNCCPDSAERVLFEIASDHRLPMQRRVNALYLLHNCDDDFFDIAAPELMKNKLISDVVQHMLKQSES